MKKSCKALHNGIQERAMLKEHRNVEKKLTTNRGILAYRDNREIQDGSYKVCLEMGPNLLQNKRFEKKTVDKNPSSKPNEFGHTSWVFQNLSLLPARLLLLPKYIN